MIDYSGLQDCSDSFLSVVCHRARTDYRRSIIYQSTYCISVWSDLFRRVRIDVQNIIRLSIHQCVGSSLHVCVPVAAVSSTLRISYLGHNLEIRYA